MKRILAVIWFLSLVAVTLLAIVSLASAQTNSLTFYDSQGRAYTIALSAGFASTLAAIAGFAWLARIVLRFLPTPRDGSFMAWVVGSLKVVGAVTPEKHQADISISKPTDNGLQPSPDAKPPTTNIRP